MTHMPRRVMDFTLFLCLASSQLCLGGLKQEVTELSKTYDVIVFGHEAKRFAGKYVIRGLDPESQVIPHYIGGGPGSQHDDKIKRFEDRFTTLLQGVIQDESVTFEKIRELLPDCSTGELAVTILLVDKRWPAKKGEIRTLLEGELKRRGQATTIEATFDRGWLEYRDGALAYRKCSMYDLLENTGSN